MQALEGPMYVTLGAEIGCPQLRCFGNCGSGVLSKWVKGRQTVDERE